jgi:hypothetical protein
MTKTKILILLVGLCVAVLGILCLAQGAQAFNYGTGTYGSCVYGGELGTSALTFSVNTSSVSLSNANTSAAKTATATFAVTLNCSNHGYIVTANGTAPKNGSYTLANMSSPATSSPGSEQFGINLVANTTPSVGSNPSGGSGTAASGYATTNQFKYVSGNTIASASANSSQTTFTVSYLLNVSNVTPALTYSTTQTLICTATY